MNHLSHQKLISMCITLIVSGCGGSSPDDKQDKKKSKSCLLDSDCDDDVYCNGKETCSPEDEASDVQGCSPGKTRSCDDEDSDTVDSCDPAEDACQHISIARDTQSQSGGAGGTNGNSEPETGGARGKEDSATGGSKSNEEIGSGGTAVGGNEGSGGADDDLKNCPAGYFRPDPLTDECQAFTPCAPGEYEEKAPTGTQDRVCLAHAICARGQFVETAGTATSDAICTPCAPEEFSTQQNALQCQSWRRCQDDEYESTAPSPLLDRSCEKVTPCSPGTLLGEPAGAQTDTYCVPCESGTFTSEDNATVCELWHQCESNEYESTQPTASQDRDCTKIRTCKGGEFLAEAATDTTDAICTPCAEGSFSDEAYATTCLNVGGLWRIALVVPDGGSGPGTYYAVWDFADSTDGSLNALARWGSNSGNARGVVSGAISARMIHLNRTDDGGFSAILDGELSNDGAEITGTGANDPFSPGGNDATFTWTAYRLPECSELALQTCSASTARPTGTWSCPTLSDAIIRLSSTGQVDYTNALGQHSIGCMDCEGRFETASAVDTSNSPGIFVYVDGSFTLESSSSTQNAEVELSYCTDMTDPILCAAAPQATTSGSCSLIVEP